MFRAKALRGETLNLRTHNAQINEIYTMIEALNKLTGLGMPKTKIIL
ncbi:hypothetical protein [Candidatus Enterovibrio altilux]|uniref:Mobile element protein n=1 Tax=Candidatus Enterovibrio altilux TaxID=1927128 RepID=A0A291B9S4_9GAMM|nr:Mobile element protein [Candidatus Enterovibrio luxaltus]